MERIYRSPKLLTRTLLKRVAQNARNVAVNPDTCLSSDPESGRRGFLPCFSAVIRLLCMLRDSKETCREGISLSGGNYRIS